MKIRVVRTHVGLHDAKALERTIKRDKNNETVVDAITRWLDEDEGQGELLTNFNYCKMLDVYAYSFKREQWIKILDLKCV